MTREEVVKHITEVLLIPSSGHASAAELAETIADGLMVKEELCEDEGCPQHGMDHVCRSVIRHREPLPDRREADSITATHQWVPGDDRQDEHMVLTIGRYEDGRIGEVFIDYTDKKMLKNERAKNLGHDIATLISIALQYGAPLEVLRDSVGRGEIPWMGGKKRYPHTDAGNGAGRVGNRSRPCTARRAERVARQ